MQLKIYNHTGEVINTTELIGVGELFAEEGVVEVSFVEADEMRDLNLRYKGKDKVTDVLSFTYEDDHCRGEIVIYPHCYEDTPQEIDKLIIHGVLHILGYVHEEGGERELVMEERQKKLLRQWKMQDAE